MANVIALSIFYVKHPNKHNNQQFNVKAAQPAITCSKLTIETLEQGVKYVQS